MTLELFAALPLVSVTGARWQTFVGAEHKKHSTFTWPARATKTEMEGADFPLLECRFDLARSLATARNLAEVVELRAIYWRKQLSSLPAQAEEVRELSAKLAVEMAAPMKAHVSRSMEKLRDELSPKAK